MVSQRALREALGPIFPAEQRALRALFLELVPTTDLGAAKPIAPGKRSKKRG